MRLINNKTGINFDEELEISMTLKELLVLYGALAVTDSKDVINCIERFQQTKEVSKVFKEIDLPYQTYKQVLDILREKHIHL